MGYLMSFSPFDFSKHFAFGLGIGVGIGVVIRKVIREKTKQREHLISCLKQLAAEVRQLRETFISTVASKSKLRQIKSGIDSSDEDEFFDTEKGHDSALDNLEDFILKLDRLQDGSSADQQDAYNLLITKTNEIQDNCELLWRLAKSQYQVSELKEKAGDKDAQKLINEKGIHTAEKAIKIDDENFRAHQWYAILIGNNIQFLETKEKILSGYKYKQHIERAIELKPDNATSYYLLGRYCFEIFMLPWYMRKAAAALFASPPEATADDALQHFLKAEELNPGFWTENPLYIGKCYYHKWDYANAKIWFRKAVQAKTKSPEDEKAREEALALLKKC